MKKIITVLGARPQFIKASVVSSTISSLAAIEEILIHTGQHFDDNMSAVFFEELAMPKPRYHLEIHGGAHGQMTGRMLERIEQVLLTEKPDVVMVYGDTNSTLAGALAAVKLHIPVVHVESGLRSGNMKMPEEVNRVLTDHISKLLFTPTESASRNLQREGIEEINIVQTGDVMYDVALKHGALLNERGRAIARLGITPSKYALVTIHRAENTDNLNRLETIVKGIFELSRNLSVVWPLHPRTRVALQRINLLSQVPNWLRLIEPVGYLDMMQLEKYAAVIVTDSGGVQKEAFFHRVPCVTLRQETEWTELIESGWNRLVDTSSSKEITIQCLSAIGRIGMNISPYGEGRASEIIASRLMQGI
jgi:UDP-GlcNAc3NAcA epimerase